MLDHCMLDHCCVPLFFFLCHASVCSLAGGLIDVKTLQSKRGHPYVPKLVRNGGKEKVVVNKEKAWKEGEII
jgi:hypothetical protein